MDSPAFASVRRFAVALVAACLCGAGPARAEWFSGQRAVIGFASWYGYEFAWRRTASGAIFDPKLLTAAHRTLPLGSRVRVTNLRNGRSVLLTVNDRGPFRGQREIDLSLGAARTLGFVERGIERVLIEPLI
jgi:rare lipoprotein A